MKEKSFIPRDDRLIALVRQWVEKAEGDLRNAAHVVKLERACPTDTVCFHAQQCVEKYLKALLVLTEIEFPKTHNIEEMMALIPAGLRPSINYSEQDKLTDYATVMRYPGDYEPISLAEARAAVKLARRVRRDIRKHLPRSVLPKRKS